MDAGSFLTVNDGANCRWLSIGQMTVDGGAEAAAPFLLQIPRDRDPKRPLKGLVNPPF